MGFLSKEMINLNFKGKFSSILSVFIIMIECKLVYGQISVNFPQLQFIVGLIFVWFVRCWPHSNSSYRKPTNLLACNQKPGNRWAQPLSLELGLFEDNNLAWAYIYTIGIA